MDARAAYSIAIKDNRYNAPQYCFLNSPVCQSLPPGPYYITQLDPNMNIEWQFQNTTIDTGHPNGYEWCINIPAIDSSGNVYVNSEDGNIYVLPQGHSGIFTTPGGKMFLNIALGLLIRRYRSDRTASCTRKIMGICLLWGISAVLRGEAHIPSVYLLARL